MRGKKQVVKQRLSKLFGIAGPLASFRGSAVKQQPSLEVAVPHYLERWKQHEVKQTRFLLYLKKSCRLKNAEKASEAMDQKVSISYTWFSRDVFLEPRGSGRNSFSRGLVLAFPSRRRRWRSIS